jgi:hypothetical protein
MVSGLSVSMGHFIDHEPLVAMGPLVAMISLSNHEHFTCHGVFNGHDVF